MVVRVEGPTVIEFDPDAELLSLQRKVGAAAEPEEKGAVAAGVAGAAALRDPTDLNVNERFHLSVRFEATDTAAAVGVRVTTLVAPVVAGELADPRPREHPRLLGKFAGEVNEEPVRVYAGAII